MKWNGTRFLGATIIFIVVASSKTAGAGSAVLFESDNEGIIYRFDANGQRTVFSNGLNDPLGLAFDAVGNLFASDLTTRSIYKFTPNGTKSTFASGLPGIPSGLAFDANGNLYASISEVNFGVVYKFAPNGTGTLFSTGFRNPLGVAFDGSGNLFVADQSGAIYKVDPNGNPSLFASGFGELYGLAINPTGNLFASDFLDGAIFKFQADGSSTEFANGITDPLGLAFDSDGDLFVANGAPHGNTIVEITPNGSQSTFATNVEPSFVAFAVPEPSSILLAVLGFMGCLSVQRRSCLPSK